MIINNTISEGTWLSILPDDIINKINKILAIDFIINYYYSSNKRVDTTVRLVNDNLYPNDYFSDVHIEILFKIRELFKSKIIHNLDVKFWKRKLNLISNILYSSNIYYINGRIFYRYDIFTRLAQTFYSKIIYNTMSIR